MRKTHDYIHEYRGSWRDGGRCRIAIYAPEVGEVGRCPVIVAAELDENEGSSVTNMAEYLAAEIVARHFPQLLDAPAVGDQPVVCLGYYPPGCRGRESTTPILLMAHIRGYETTYRFCILYAPPLATPERTYSCIARTIPSV